MKNVIRTISIGCVWLIALCIPFRMSGQYSLMVSGDGQLRMLPSTADDNVGMTYYNFLPQYKPLTKSVTITRYYLYYNADLGDYTRCNSCYNGECDNEYCRTTNILYDEQGRVIQVSNCSFQYEDNRITEYQVGEGHRCRFKYDPQNLLESATQGKWTYKYNLDKNRNITKVNGFFDAESRGAKTKSGFQYDSNHRMIAYQGDYCDYRWNYDKSGNLISYRDFCFSFSKGKEGGKTSDHEYQFEYGEDGNPIRCTDYKHGDITVIDGMYEYEYKYTFYHSHEELEKLDYEEAIDIDSVDMKPSYPEGEELFIIGLLQNANGMDSAIVDYIIENKEIVVSFIVEPDGNVSNMKVLTEDGFVIDEEIARAISSMPKWEPGWVGGEKVRVAVKLSLELQINR